MPQSSVFQANHALIHYSLAFGPERVYLHVSTYLCTCICVYTLYMYAILKVHVSLVSLFSIHFLIGQAGGRRCGTQASYSGNLSSL